MYKIKTNEKPKWFQFRRWLSRWLANLAQKIYPTSPEVYAFFIKQALDIAITGESIIRISTKKDKNS